MASRAGRSLSSSSITAAMCRAEGKVSLLLWDLLTSSLGCRTFSPAISLPRLAMTSFTFMLVWVPLPVCQTTRGKCPASFPSQISSQTLAMRSALSLERTPSSALARAQAFFRRPKAWMICPGMLAGSPMGKCILLRSVCAPQYLSLGTCTSPMLSFSMRNSMSQLPYSSRPGIGHAPGSGKDPGAAQTRKHEEIR